MHKYTITIQLEVDSPSANDATQVISESLNHLLGWTSRATTLTQWTIKDIERTLIDGIR